MYFVLLQIPHHLGKPSPLYFSNIIPLEHFTTTVCHHLCTLLYWTIDQCNNTSFMPRNNIKDCTLVQKVTFQSPPWLGMTFLVQGSQASNITIPCEYYLQYPVNTTYNISLCKWVSSLHIVLCFGFICSYRNKQVFCILTLPLFGMFWQLQMVSCNLSQKKPQNYRTPMVNLIF